MKRKYQPKKIKRARKHGFFSREPSLLNKRRKKGRWKLTV